jgi:hypothetical protein
MASERVRELAAASCIEGMSLRATHLGQRLSPQVGRGFCPVPAAFMCRIASKPSLVYNAWSRPEV